MSDVPLITQLRIEGLRLRGLKAIQSLELPAQGLGWGDRIPDVVLVGGINGSGKTTLLRCFVNILQSAFRPPQRPDKVLFPAEIVLDLSAHDTHNDPIKIRFIQGDAEFYDSEAQPDARFNFGYRRRPGERPLYSYMFNDTLKETFDRSSPRVIYLSDERALTVIDESYKAPGSLREDQNFIYLWQQPTHWGETLEALFYSARWADLNAKEQGQPSALFQDYAEEFYQLTDQTKRLVWSVHGELEVETTDGVRHPLEALSSGEKQVLVMITELKRRWSPGSLVLIDEPELHLHEALQSRLYNRIMALQHARGGQVWMTTQSAHLFEIGETNSKLLLKGPLR